MARILLQSYVRDPNALQGFPWYYLVIAVGGALVLFIAAAISVRMASLYLALKQGRVAAHLVLTGESLPCERTLFLTARCPVTPAQFKAGECPVCLTEIQRRRRWVEFPCHHGVCKCCLWQLVKAEQRKSACPLCRTSLFQIVAGAAQPGAAAEVPPATEAAVGVEHSTPTAT